LIHYQTVTLTGTHDFTPREFDLALKLIERRIIDVRPLVSHTFPLEQTGEAFDVVVERAGLKVMVEMA
jgi:threonine dehydrogenase-like Zn-dependent dehydrogenase